MFVDNQADVKKLKLLKLESILHEQVCRLTHGCRYCTLKHYLLNILESLAILQLNMSTVYTLRVANYDSCIMSKTTFSQSFKKQKMSV